MIAVWFWMFPFFIPLALIVGVLVYFRARGFANDHDRPTMA
jgi:hypothetical protein